MSAPIARCAVTGTFRSYAAHSIDLSAFGGNNDETSLPIDSPRPMPSSRPRHAARLSISPVSFAAPKSPLPSVASTSSLVDPARAISVSWTSTEPLTATAVTNPRLIKSITIGAKPVLTTWPPIPQMIGFPRSRARCILIASSFRDCTARMFGSFCSSASTSMPRRPR